MRRCRQAHGVCCRSPPSPASSQAPRSSEAPPRHDQAQPKPLQRRHSTVLPGARRQTRLVCIDPAPSALPRDLLGTQYSSCTRYRLGMAQEAEARSGHAIARLADSGEDGMRHLVALPLRMRAGALGTVEALLRTAADAVSEGDPIDERVVDLERRMD